MFIDRPAPRSRALNLGLNLKFGNPLFLSLADQIQTLAAASSERQAEKGRIRVCG